MPGHFYSPLESIPELEWGVLRQAVPWPDPVLIGRKWGRVWWYFDPARSWPFLGEWGDLPNEGEVGWLVWIRPHQLVLACLQELQYREDQSLRSHARRKLWVSIEVRGAIEEFSRIPKQEVSLKGQTQRPTISPSAREVGKTEVIQWELQLSHTFAWWRTFRPRIAERIPVDSW